MSEMVVYTSSGVRKKEFATKHSKFDTILGEAREYINETGNVLSVSKGDYSYSIYFSGKPLTTSFDLVNVETEPLGHDIIQIKYNLSTKEKECKVYSFNPEEFKDYPFQVIGVGRYLNKDKYTIYYTKNRNIALDITNPMLHIYEGNTFATTYENGVAGEESHYIHN